MIRTRSRRVMVVAPVNFPKQLIVGYSDVIQVSSISRVFPSIHEQAPDLLILDYDFLGKDLERILRRITVNKFYNKIAIHCFKTSRSEKVDSLLKVLGVDQFIYGDNLVKDKKAGGVLDAVNSIIDTSIANLATSVSN